MRGGTRRATAVALVLGLGSVLVLAGSSSTGSAVEPDARAKEQFGYIPEYDVERGLREYVAFLKTGSASYAPAAAAVQMAEAIVKDKKRILPCAAWLQGEYGMNDMYLGVPCVLGEGGLQRIFEVELDADEKAALASSAEHVRSTVAALKALEA